MRNFQRFLTGYNTTGILHEILRQPELWDKNRFRTTYEGTPHADVSDIWVRFSSLEKCYSPEVLGEVQNDDSSVWYEPKDLLPSLKPTVLDIMRIINGYSLLRLLITRTPPGGRILPHADTDGAYVNLPDIARYHLIIQGAEANGFRCGSEIIQMLTGELWWFNANLEHERYNESTTDALHLIIDARIW